MKFRLLVVPVLALVAATLALSSSAKASPSLAPQTLTVKVGGGVTGIATESFFPNTITVNAGDTIHFVNPWPEPHTATYLVSGPPVLQLIVPDPGGSPAQGFNPLIATPSPASPATFDATKNIGSGILQQNGTYDVKFSAGTTGTFKFLCAFHPMMLTVKVVTAGGDTQATIDAEASTQQANAINVGQAGVQAEMAKGVTSEKLADGTTNWHITPGGGIEGGPTSPDVDFMQFFPPQINIKTGDTITWNNASDTPHTVSFLNGAAVPPLVSPIPEGAGPPFLALNPQIVFPQGSATYDGKTAASSGLIGTGFPNPPTYALKFSAPGTFTYLCMLHSDQGMIGTVNVSGAALPASTTPGATTSGITAPNTGSGPAGGGTGSGSWYAALALVTLAGAALALGGVCTARPRAR